MQARNHLSLLLVPLALVLLPNCATQIQVTRHQDPLIQVHGLSEGIGVLAVEADDEVMAKAPNDFSNMTGLIIKAAKDHLKEKDANLPVVNYSDLEFRPRWVEDHSPLRTASLKIDSLDGVPAGVKTPLVMVVKVLDWRITTQQPAPNSVSKQPVEVANVQLITSIWTKEGEHVSSKGQLIELKGQDRQKTFYSALEQAMAQTLYPYLPHDLDESYVLVDDEPNKAGALAAKAGNYDQALEAWNRVLQADAKNHGAMYNAAIVHILKGDDQKALELLSKAQSVDDRLLYRSVIGGVKARVVARKEVGAPADAAGN